MNTSDQKASTPGPIAAIVFYTLNIILFPVSLLGYVIWVGMMYLNSGRSGVSGTAQGPLSARWLQHNLGTRPDDAANRLMPAVPGVPRLGLVLTSVPLLLAHRLTGYVPKAFRYPFEGEVDMQVQSAARQTYFDAGVQRYLPEVSQFVILGAGFDTRAYNLPEGARVRAFEIDTPQTQAVKRQVLAKAGVDASGVTFVPADFETQDWLELLVDAGFDPGKPALFLWEGVIIYLDRAAVEATLRKIGSTAKGSVLVFDYFTTETLESQAPYWRFARWSTKAAGEPLKFGIDATPPSRERVTELLAACGLTLADQRTLGPETDGKRAWGGFATAVVK